MEHSANTSAAEVQRSLSRFMNCFDLKDWATMEDLLADAVRVDYFDLRGEPPGVVSASDFVAARIAALQSIKTHHVIANFDVEVIGRTAHARATCVIYRTDGKVQFTSHAVYDFGLAYSGASWKIESIRQSILWNDGDSKLHAGVPK